MRDLIKDTLKANKKSLINTALLSYISSFVYAGYQLSTNPKITEIALALFLAYIIPTLVILLIFFTFLILESFKT